MTAKILMLAAFFALMTGVGLYYSRRAGNVEGFVLGGRSVGGWFTAFAYGTSYFSAVIFVGYAGQFGWRFGVASTWIGVGNAVIGSWLAWSVLGRRTRLMTRHLRTRTMPEFFEKRYASPGLRVASALIIFVFLIPYAASLYNGLSRLFAMAFSVDYALCILVMAGLTALYVVAGGYMATVMNDFIQGIIMLVGILVIVGAALGRFGGVSAALEALARVTDESVSAAPGIFTSFFGPDFPSLLGVVVLTSLGTWSLPQMTQKFYAIRDEDAITKGTVISTLFALAVAGGCYFLGGFGRLLGSELDVAALGFDAIIPAMLSHLSPALIGFVVVLVLAASMSTLSSLVLTASSCMTLDLIHRRRRAGEKTQLAWIRGLVVVFILLSAVLAIVQYRYSFAFIAQLMGLSWGAMAGAFLGPFLYGLYSKRISAAAVWVSFGFGTGVMLLNMLAPGLFPGLLRSPVNCGAFVMLASLVLTPLVSLLTPLPDRGYTEKVFACYEKKTVVTARFAIGEERPEEKKETEI